MDTDETVEERIEAYENEGGAIVRDNADDRQAVDEVV